jgi:hypothetical protein
MERGQAKIGEGDGKNGRLVKHSTAKTFRAVPNRSITWPVLAKGKRFDNGAILAFDCIGPCAPAGARRAASQQPHSSTGSGPKSIHLFTYSRKSCKSPPRLCLRRVYQAWRPPAASPQRDSRRLARRYPWGGGENRSILGRSAARMACTPRLTRSQRRRPIVRFRERASGDAPRSACLLQEMPVEPPNRFPREG